MIPLHVQGTFMISYLILFASTIITLVESLRINNKKARHILNLETAISIVAGYMYYIFVTKVKNPAVELKDITYFRYLDWFITTPMMLLAIMLVFNYYNDSLIPVWIYLLVFILNFGMLMAGFLGETKKLDKNIAVILGFLFFLGFLSVIWYFVVRKDSRHYLVFGLFTLIWSMYGIAYMLDEETKNIMYNILDVIAKSIFGLCMWLYYGHVLHF